MKRRYPYGRLFILVCLFCLVDPVVIRAQQSSSTDGDTVYFALIVGVNRSIEADRPALRFADDDALQTHALLRQLAQKENVVLLSEIDRDTRPLATTIARALPTRANLNGAMKRLNEQMHAAKKSGRQAVFFFFYTGHGNVKNNEGYVALSDGLLTRTDLMTLLQRSEATTNHVVIDACKSFYMVFPRGPGGRRQPATGKFLVNEARLPDNTGVFLSTSAGNDSHEWEAFQGGIFSHEFRSALRGGADVDENREITYEEVAAFIWRANEAIPVPRFRPGFFVHPPGGAPASRSVLANLKRARGNWLSLSYGTAEHQYLEDDMGRRILDIHPATGATVALLIPDHRPLFMRFPKTGREIAIPTGNKINLEDQTATPWQFLSRGAAHESFSRIFSLPYDAAAMDAYRAQLSPGFSPQTPMVDHATSRWPGALLGGTALTSLIAGGVLTGLGIAEHNKADYTYSGTEIDSGNQRIAAYNTGAVVCYGVAATAFTMYLIWRLKRKRQRAPAIAMEGFMLKGTF